MEIEEYLKRAETAEVLYCETHDSEYFDFEQCPCCEREKCESISEIADIIDTTSRKRV